MSPLQVLAAVTVGVLGALAGTPPPPPHTLEEAAHRMDMVLNNTRSRDNYIRCFMDKGICNKEATSIKRILADALATNCSNCTDLQRLGVDKIFRYLQSHQPDTWVSLSEKYRGAGGGRHHDHDDDDDDDDHHERKGGKQKSKSGGGGSHMATTEAGHASEAENSTIHIIF